MLFVICVVLNIYASVLFRIEGDVLKIMLLFFYKSLELTISFLFFSFFIYIDLFFLKINKNS